MHLFLIFFYLFGANGVGFISAKSVFLVKNVAPVKTVAPLRNVPPFGIVPLLPNNLEEKNINIVNKTSTIDETKKTDDKGRIIDEEKGIQNGEIDKTIDAKVDEKTKKYFPEAYSGLVEGDIIMPELGQRNALFHPDSLWPNGMVPYVIEPYAFDSTAMFMIREAMNRIQARTCIYFVPYNEDGPHVRIGSETPNACYSVIGYQPGSNKINFGVPDCFNYATLQHELLHTLGLHHEHNRVDRDSYLDINMNNVDNKFTEQFNLAPKDLVTTFNLPYDYQSVMHYPRTAFSLNAEPTMTAKNNFMMELGNRVGPSSIDIEKINMMYQCNQVKPMNFGDIGPINVFSYFK